MHSLGQSVDQGGEGEELGAEGLRAGDWAKGAGPVDCSLGGAPARIYINKAQPAILSDRFINTHGAAVQADRSNKGGRPPRSGGIVT